MRRVAFALAATATLLLGACGIPGDSAVRVLATGPAAAPPPGDSDVTLAPVIRTTNPDTRKFIRDYLSAAAGDDPESIKKQVASFLAPEAQREVKLDSRGVEVVRGLNDPLVTPDNPVVTWEVQRIGWLNSDGILTPDPHSEPKLRFEITTDSDGGHHLRTAPATMVLSDAALAEYYQPHTIYHWNAGNDGDSSSDNTGLVPDIRYLPRTLPSVQRPTQILKWLADAPPDWLQGVINAWPAHTTVPDNIPAVSDDLLQVRLSQEAIAAGSDAGTQLDRLRRQIQWSMEPDTPGRISLTIGHNSPVTYAEDSAPSFLPSNASARLNEPPEKFAIWGGVIHRTNDSNDAAAPVPVLKTQANKGLQAAAFSSTTGHTFAAVVTAAKNPALQLAVAPIGEQADLQTVRGLKAPLGRPSWAITTAGDKDQAVGLITSQGQLYSFNTESSQAQPVQWADNVSRQVTSFSIAPDGHRVVLVIGGQLYRTVLTIDSGVVTLGTLQPILAANLHAISSVSWTGEGWLAVAGIGAAGRSTIVSLPIDGGDATPIISNDLGDSTVTDLTAYPVSPNNPQRHNYNAMVYESGGLAYTGGGFPTRIEASDMYGAPAVKPAGALNPIAPFYLQ